MVIEQYKTVLILLPPPQGLLERLSCPRIRISCSLYALDNVIIQLELLQAVYWQFQRASGAAGPGQQSVHAIGVAFQGM